MKSIKFITAAGVILKMTFLFLALTTTGVFSGYLYAALAIAAGVFTQHYIVTNQHHHYEQK